MTEKPMPIVRKLLPRHTAAGIEVSYDDHCVSLRRNGQLLSRKSSEGTITVAVWTSHVTFEQMVKEADYYIFEKVKNEIRD